MTHLVGIDSIDTSQEVVRLNHCIIMTHWFGRPICLEYQPSTRSQPGTRLRQGRLFMAHIVPLSPPVTARWMRLLRANASTNNTHDNRSAATPWSQAASYGIHSSWSVVAQVICHQKRVVLHMLCHEKLVVTQTVLFKGCCDDQLVESRVLL